MQFLKTFLAAAAVLASVSAANTVTFVNQDSTARTIIFTPNIGCEELEPLNVPGNGQATQEFPHSYIGNFYSVSEGAEASPGMLGEVTFQGYLGDTWFDVSSIVSSTDVVGIKQIFPANTNSPVSGCQNVPCENMYKHPDDIATKSTTETDLICLIGNLSTERKRGAVAAMHHDFVNGKRHVQ